MGDRVTVQEAAKRLGVKDDAIRKRIQRGSLEHDKGLDGRVYVYLDVHEPANGKEEGSGTRAVTQDTLLQTLREQIAFLRGELERKDTIILALTSRIPESEAPREPRGGPEVVAEEPQRGGASTGGERPSETSWWRRVFGG
jgi:excisionase family DNA binding protein